MHEDTFAQGPLLHECTFAQIITFAQKIIFGGDFETKKYLKNNRKINKKRLIYKKKTKQKNTDRG